MIARHWRGWTRREDADAYSRLLTELVLPNLRSIPGYAGGYVLRQESADETEFIVINLFESLAAVRAFAGEDYETPVFEPQALKLLSRFETMAHHFHVEADTT
jgi:heme-degrading monooxygenase HmoA